MKPIQFLFALLGSVTFGAIFAMSNSAQNTRFPSPNATATFSIEPYSTETAYPSAYPTTFSPRPTPSSSLLPSPQRSTRIR